MGGYAAAEFISRLSLRYAARIHSDMIIDLQCTGVSGPLWYAAGATVQILLFATVAIELKRRAPNAHVCGPGYPRLLYMTDHLSDFPRSCQSSVREMDALHLHCIWSIYKHPRHSYAADRWIGGD